MLDHKIEFIIYGFIYLDFEMFVSVSLNININLPSKVYYLSFNFQIMGTIATYLLILVQLGSSPDVLEQSLNVTTVPVTPETYATKGM